MQKISCSKKSAQKKIKNTFQASKIEDRCPWIVVVAGLSRAGLLLCFVRAGLSICFKKEILLTYLDVVYLSYVGFYEVLGLLSLLFSISTLLSLLFLSILSYMLLFFNKSPYILL